MLGPAQLLPREEAKANTAGIHDADANTDADSRRRPKKEGAGQRGMASPGFSITRACEIAMSG